MTIESQDAYATPAAAPTYFFLPTLLMLTTLFTSLFWLFFLNESSSSVEIRLHTGNQLPGYPGSGQKASNNLVSPT